MMNIHELETYGPQGKTIYDATKLVLFWKKATGVIDPGTAVAVVVKG